MLTKLVPISCVLLFYVNLCFALPYQYQSKIVEYRNERNGTNYNFRYYTDEGQEREETGKIVTKGNEEILVVSGFYRYTGTDGKKHTTKYESDENGFRSTNEVMDILAGFPSAALASLAGGGLG